MCPISISARTRQSTWSTDAPEASGARNLGICLIGGLPHCFYRGAARGVAEGGRVLRPRQGRRPGVLSAVSVGFRPIDAEPIKNGRGVLWKAWELLELSLVAVPSNPNAVVMERAFGKDGRVLAGQHGDALMRAHQRITSARTDIHDVLKAAARIPADDGDGYDPEADEDEELAFDAARLKREQMRGRASTPTDLSGASTPARRGGGSRSSAPCFRASTRKRRTMSRGLQRKPRRTSDRERQVNDAAKRPHTRDLHSSEPNSYHLLAPGATEKTDEDGHFGRGQMAVANTKRVALHLG
jgi:hypothetical protein